MDEHSDKKRKTSEVADSAGSTGIADNAGKPTFIDCYVQLVGLFALNPAKKFKTDGKYELKAGEELTFSTDPADYEQDVRAVNVYAKDGKWATKQLGHIATVCSCPRRNLMWGHTLHKLMEWERRFLPPWAEQFEHCPLTFSGHCLEKTTHAAVGSKILLRIQCPELALALSVAEFLNDKDVPIIIESA
jgi:hypothetical protein